MRATITSDVIKVRLDSQTPFNMESYTEDGKLVIVITRGNLEPTPPLPGQITIDEVLEKE